MARASSTAPTRRVRPSRKPCPPPSTRRWPRVIAQTRTEQQQVFRLFGYAGSGKTTVLKFALDELGLSPHRSAKEGRCVPGVVTATFTGKAALVLTRKGTPARTIHSLIYSVIEATEEEIEEAARKIAVAELDALRLTGFARTTADAAIEAMRQGLSAMKHPRFCGFRAISAVARIYRPGVKADHMLILEGPQGARKSTAIKVLAGEEWFTDELPELGSKDAALHMQGVWIVEIAELDAIGRAEVSRIKAFLTRTTDRFRPPYGRYTVEVPRQCVFAGTVNPDTYLRDETGNRRFWPLRCGAIDIAALARDRDQLWAEAVHRFRAGAIWWIDDPALLAEAREEQDRRYQSDAWDDLIEHWLTHEVRTVPNGYPDYGNSRTETVPRPEPLSDVSVGEILEEAIGLEPARWTRGDQMRVSAYLKANGWERYRRRDEGGREAPREWRYRRGVG